jgi:nucleoside-diphosphate-sugar epimerase
MTSVVHERTVSSNPARVFVTGASGFIGRRICDRYRAAGVEVRGVDLQPAHELGIVAGDIAEPGEWQERVAGCDLVVHTAARVSMTAGMDRFWRVNTLGTRRVLDAAVAADVGRVVHLSSVTVFGFAFPDRVDETYPVHPTGVPYVDTKIASEQVVLQAHAAGEIVCTVIRPGDVYGPGSRPWTIIPVNQLRAARAVLPAGGRGVFSPVYAENLVDGIVLAAAGGQTEGEVLTITDGVGVETREFFGRYARMLGKKGVPAAPTPLVAVAADAIDLAARLRRRESEINRDAVRYLSRTGTYSIEKARRLIGYEPRIDLDEGMRRTEAWLQDQRLVSPGDGRIA